MNGTTAKNLQLDFGSLPLIEAAVRASLASPIKLTFELVNRTHELLRAEFPQISEPKQIEVPPGVGAGTIELGPGQIPGVVYAGGSTGVSVTVQSQLLVARWTRDLLRRGPDYPRFPSLRAALQRAIDALTQTRPDGALPIKVVNISYVNFIKTQDPASVLREFFSDLVQIRATTHAERIHVVELSWRAQDAVDLRFRLERVEAVVDEERVDGYRLTTVAGTIVSEPTRALDSLDFVHQQLQVLFRDVLSDRAKRLWQLEVPENG